MIIPYLIQQIFLLNLSNNNFEVCFKKTQERFPLPTKKVENFFFELFI